MARIIPTDHSPARGKPARSIPRPLPLGHRLHLRKPDGSGFETLDRQARRRVAAARRDPAQDLCRGHRGARRAGQARLRRRFARLERGQQDRCSHGALGSAGAHRPAAPRRAPDPRCSRRSTETELDFLPLLVLHTRQGFYADPIYGGNRDHVGWNVIGFPGPASLVEVFTGPLHALPWFAEARREKYREANRGV